MFLSSPCSPLPPPPPHPLPVKEHVVFLSPTPPRPHPPRETSTLLGKLPALLDFCAWDLILTEWLPWGPSTSLLSTRYTNSLMAWIWPVLFSAVSQHLLQSQHADIVSLHRYSMNKWKMTESMTPGVPRQGVILLLPQRIFGNVWKYLGMSFRGAVATGLGWVKVKGCC